MIESRSDRTRVTFMVWGVLTSSCRRHFTKRALSANVAAPYELESDRFRHIVELCVCGKNSSLESVSFQFA